MRNTLKNDLRVMLTRRMLKEGLLAVMARKPLSKITVSELCAAVGGDLFLNCVFVCCYSGLKSLEKLLFCEGAALALPRFIRREITDGK